MIWIRIIYLSGIVLIIGAVKFGINDWHPHDQKIQIVAISHTLQGQKSVEVFNIPGDKAVIGPAKKPPAPQEQQKVVSVSSPNDKALGSPANNGAVQPLVEPLLPPSEAKHEGIDYKEMTYEYVDSIKSNEGNSRIFVGYASPK